MRREEPEKASRMRVLSRWRAVELGVELDVVAVEVTEGRRLPEFLPGAVDGEGSAVGGGTFGLDGERGLFDLEAVAELGFAQE